MKFIKTFNEKITTFPTKELLLHELGYNTYCILKRSNVSGVGVFAIRDIPAGVIPFEPDVEDWVDIEEEEFNKLPEEVRELIITYCIKKNGKWSVPEYGFKVWDMVNFLNHSDEPNIDAEDFKALIDIKKGEELFMDYNDLSDEDIKRLGLEDWIDTQTKKEG